jgi:enoyl-CoA hydratase/carnithine racemase
MKHKILNTELKNKSIYIMTLNNSIKRNPLSLELISTIQKELVYIKKNKNIKVVIIKSIGPSFCSGHDLKEVKQSSSSKNKLIEIFKTCSKMMLSIRSLPLPVIACVDGVAAAAGCQLVASCDLAVASKESSFQTPGVNIGLFCSTPMVSISRKVQIKDMMYMLLTGDALSASKAKEIGLINEVVMKKDLDKKVLYIANKIASKSLQSIKIGKEAFYNQLEMPIEDAYAYTSKVMTLNMQTSDAKEGVNAFIQKRKPVWEK